MCIFVRRYQMSKIICEICGTTYPDTAECCPICGCPKDMSGNVTEDDLVMDQMPALNKGGRYSSGKKKKEIFDFDEQSDDFPEPENEPYSSKPEDDEENYDEQPREHNTAVVVILTALIVIENCGLDETVTFSNTAVNSLEPNSSILGARAGDTLSVRDCLYALLLQSANEVANALAEHCAGSIDAFAEKMNEKAAELGCTDSHFANPSGLNDPNHYVSAYDMALIAKAAWQNEMFRIITGTPSYMIPPTNKHADETPLQNHNCMLHPYRTSKHVYDYCVGGKTGYTNAANSTLVTYAQKDGMTLICVVMDVKSPGQWDDSRALFDYCFDNFQILNIADNETRLSGGDVDAGDFNTNEKFVDIDTNGAIVIPKTATFTDAVPSVDDSNANGSVAGRISYTYADRVVGGADIIKTGATVEPFAFKNTNGEAGTEQGTETPGDTEQAAEKTFRVNFRVILRVLLCIAGAVVVILLAIMGFSRFRIWQRRIAIDRKSKSPYKTIKASKKWRRRRRRRRR